MTEVIKREMTKQDRINLCKYSIELIKSVPDSNIRKPPALEHYERQLANLEGRPFSPPDIVVGLKTAELFAKSDPVGEN